MVSAEKKRQGYVIATIDGGNSGIEEATVNSYNDSEQASGLYTMIEENVDFPFETRLLGSSVKDCQRLPKSEHEKADVDTNGSSTAKP